MRKLWIGLIVVGVLVVAATIGVVTWLLLRTSEPFVTIELEGEGFGNVQQRAAFTRIQDTGDLFWWFYPTETTSPQSRPLILWLDGITGVPPSLSANLAGFGPFDSNFIRRNESWISDFNLLFVDAPIGTGFSSTSNADKIPRSNEENADHLKYVLESFFSLNGEYRDSPLYLFGQGHGGQLALALAIKLSERQENTAPNLQGITLGNPIISPTATLSKLGFYLEELAYVDDVGRSVIEAMAAEVQSMVDAGNLEGAFDKFLQLENVVNEEAGAIAVNLGYIVEKLTQNSLRNSNDFGQSKPLEKSVGARNLHSFMAETVAPALGIDADIVYDSWRSDVVQAFRSTFMVSAVSQVEYILQNTNLSVTVYNGNMDAVSNTPGQIDWIETLNWPGANEFRSSPRQVLVRNQQIEGYFKESPRFSFFWINVAGLSLKANHGARLIVNFGTEKPAETVGAR